MWAFLFAVVLVGFPAAAGAFLFARGQSPRSLTTGGTLIIYAVALVIYYIVFLPTGRLLEAPFSLIMPIVMAVGVLGGIVAGALQRRRDRQESG